MTVRNFLDLSTGHLTSATRARLDQGDYPSLTMSSEYGWLCYVSDEEPPHFGDGQAWGEDMIACMAKARELGCAYILFDRDAEPRDDLHFYDED